MDFNPDPRMKLLFSLLIILISGFSSTAQKRSDSPKPDSLKPTPQKIIT
jgi:hypothetical protein